MLPSIRLPACVLIALSFAVPLTPLPAQAEVAVGSGGRVTLVALGSFDQGCRSQGRIIVNVIESPHAGSILVDQINGYPNFSALNTRSRCNTLRLPQTRVRYQSAAGYAGTDEMVLEFIGPLGRVFRHRFTVSVRPGLVLQPAPEPELTRDRHARHRYVARSNLKRHSEADERRSVPPSAHEKRMENNRPIGI